MATSDDITAAIAALKTTVTNTNGVVASAVAAFEGIAAQMATLADDPGAITELSTQLQAAADTLAAAIPAAPVSAARR